MRVLKFNLGGETAFFKKPDVNAYTYFTYGQIHKLAVLGILGSCLGLKGYNQQTEDDEYPEFYEVLKDLKIAIVPKSSQNGVIRKKIQTYNNSTMFANKGTDGFGANLIVNEQWLERPKWHIYVLLEENDICGQIEDRFKTMTFKYMPYLGKNDHFANIDGVEVIDDVQSINDANRIDSMFKKEDFEFLEGSSIEEEKDYGYEWSEFKYQEKLPYKLESLTNQYILDTFIYSNMRVSSNNSSCLYKVKNLNICFI